MKAATIVALDNLDFYGPRSDRPPLVGTVVLGPVVANRQDVVCVDILDQDRPATIQDGH